MLDTLPAIAPSAKIPEDIRYVGTLSGCYILASRRKSANGRPQVFACRAASISTREVALVVPVPGTEGERLSVSLDHLGILKGQVDRLHPDGFVMAIDESPAGRARLAARIAWLKKRVMRTASENREHKRVLPHDPRSVILFADNRTYSCFIIDLSRSGVAVSADVVPTPGTVVAIGTVTGTVVRHIESGFAVAFSSVQEGDGLEARLGIHPGARMAVLAELRKLAGAGAE